MARATRSCWAPSWMLRSSRRRASSCAVTRRCRDARRSSISPAFDSTRPACDATSATSCSPGRAQRLILGHPDRDRAQQLALVHDRDAHVGVGQRRHRLAVDRQRSHVRAAAGRPPDAACRRRPRGGARRRPAATPRPARRRSPPPRSAPSAAARPRSHTRRRSAGRSRTAPDTGWPACRTRPGWPAARPTAGPAGTPAPPPPPPAPPAAGCRRLPASVPTPTTRPA